MKKESTSNSIKSFPLDWIPPDSGSDFDFLWDNTDIDDELKELILFNSINDTHRPEDHIL